MTVCLTMIVRDEEGTLTRCMNSARPFISSWMIVDTGSKDSTRELVREAVGDLPGELHERPWVDFGHNRSEALALAKDSADWLLLLDADMTVEAHLDFREWLASDHDPATDAWMVEVLDHGISYRLPLLVRGSCDLRYVGATHEYLDTSQVKRRSLLGLSVTHHGDGGTRADKLERDLALLEPGLLVDDPRSVFYSAQTLRFLGRTDEAIVLYERRASMNSFEEEAWFAEYKAAQLKGSVAGLLGAFERRPWRSEPLKAAAELVRSMNSDDVLFHGG